MDIALPPPSIAINVPAFDMKVGTVKGWTLLMALVVSGRDATGRLTRHQDLVDLLATDTSDNPNASGYQATSATGWTAFMMAACYAGWYSTEDTLRLLLSHPAAPQVALKVNKARCSALSLAIQHHRLDHVPADSLHTSSDTAALMLLDHSSATVLFKRRYERADNFGYELFHSAASSAFQAFSDCQGVSRTFVRVFENTTDTEVKNAISSCPTYVSEIVIHYVRERERMLVAQVADLHQRLNERNTLRDALNDGLSLPGSTALLYI
jgi:hypothetical protein